MNYSPKWDLSTIPAAAWASEHGRRNRAKQLTPPNAKLKPCSNCGTPLSARQRDYGGICPSCGRKGDGAKRKAELREKGKSPSKIEDAQIIDFENPNRIMVTSIPSGRKGKRK